MKHSKQKIWKNGHLVVTPVTLVVTPVQCTNAVVTLAHSCTGDVSPSHSLINCCPLSQHVW